MNHKSLLDTVLNDESVKELMHDVLAAMITEELSIKLTRFYPLLASMESRIHRLENDVRSLLMELRASVGENRYRQLEDRRVDFDYELQEEVERCDAADDSNH